MSSYSDEDRDVAEATYEVTVRITGDGPIPTEADIVKAMEALRETFPDMVAFASRI